MTGAAQESTASVYLRLRRRQLGEGGVRPEIDSPSPPVPVPVRDGLDHRLVIALDAIVGGDVVAARDASDAVLAGALKHEGIDVLGGGAGALLGCAQLAAAWATQEDAVRRVRATGEEVALELARRLRRILAGSATAGLNLGPAHGVCGATHALMRWGVVTGAGPDQVALDALEWCLALRRGSGRFPVRMGDPEVRIGWCNGSAGWALALAHAYRVLGDEQLFDVAEFLARDAGGPHPGEGSLCCGYAGRAFAALALHRLTGASGWLSSAEQLVARARARRPGDPEGRVGTLFWGSPGLELAELELRRPDRAAFPLFEPT